MVQPLGTASLIVKTCDLQLKAEFAVTKHFIPFDAILDRPWLHDIPWILLTFTHNLYVFIEYYICILESFRVITGSCTYWSKVMILGQFGAFMKALLKTSKRSRLKKTSIDGSISMSIDGKPSAKPT